MLYLIDYEKRYLSLTTSEKNFEQNNLSARINGLNSKDASMSSQNSRFFADLLNPFLTEGITLCCVPSHDPNNLNTGMSKLIRLLCADGIRSNGTNLLKRTQLIDKIALGGASTYEKHLESIEGADRKEIEGKEILLCDDIALSCNSIKVCKDKLLLAGAKKVICFVLGFAGANAHNPKKRELDRIIKTKISTKTSGHLLYKKYLDYKNEYIDETEKFSEAVYNEIFNSSNPMLINSREIAITINRDYHDLVEILTGRRKLPNDMVNSFIGVFLAYQMRRLGYTVLDKIDDHFSLYTPILYANE